MVPDFHNKKNQQRADPQNLCEWHLISKTTAHIMLRPSYLGVRHSRENMVNIVLHNILLLLRATEKQFFAGLYWILCKCLLHIKWIGTINYWPLDRTWFLSLSPYFHWPASWFPSLSKSYPTLRIPHWYMVNLQFSFDLSIAVVLLGIRSARN